MLEITLELIIKHLGNYEKKQGDEYVFQCPICLDTGKNNLKWNDRKKLFTCFGNTQHSRQILSDMNRLYKPIIQHAPDTKQWEINTDEYLIYMVECNNDLMASDKALNSLYEYKLINPFTVEKCGVGFDTEDKKWVFPIIEFSTDKIKGFEYRGWDLQAKKIWKEKDSPSCLAIIYGAKKNKNLYITEGFLDGYILAQWKDYADDMTIVTPTMGVGTLLSAIPSIDFSNFENIYLCLDNDEAGQKTLIEILKAYPFMIDRTPKPKKGKDITDLYREYLNEKAL